MRAVFYERQGAPHEVLQVGDLPTPVPAAGEVRVRVHASGVNPSDTYGRSGRFGGMAFPRVVPHQDGAGVIDAVGPGVPPDRVGERVWVFEATWNRASGTAAEYTVVPAARAVNLPDSMTFSAGACVGVPVLTAHRAVFVGGPVTGKTVLVTGGAGSVGRYAVQWAKWGGARTVLATVSSDDKARLARDAGADHTIDYKREDVAERVKQLVGRVEHIAEVDFGGNLATILAILAPGGSLGGYASRGNQEPSVPFRALMNLNANVHAILVYSMPEEAKQQAMADLARAAGQLKHNIAATYALEQTAEAHAAVEAGALVGHAVVEVVREA
jgi:NADPH2:quinone reductase